jgi:hypothetical protein
MLAGLEQKVSKYQGGARWSNLHLKKNVGKVKSCQYHVESIPSQVCILLHPEYDRISSVCSVNIGDEPNEDTKGQDSQVKLSAQALLGVFVNRHRDHPELELIAAILL